MCVHFFRRCRTLFFASNVAQKQSRVGLFDVNRATWKLANCSSSECAFLTIFNSRSLGVFSGIYHRGVYKVSSDSEQIVSCNRMTLESRRAKNLQYTLHAPDELIV
jgi:hypothetical protein